MITSIHCKSHWIHSGANRSANNWLDNQRNRWQVCRVPLDFICVFGALKLKLSLTCVLVSQWNILFLYDLYNFCQDTLIRQRENMPYGDLKGHNILLPIFNGLAAEIHNACCYHNSCCPCISTHAILDALQKGLAACQESGFHEPHPSRASDVLRWWDAEQTWNERISNASLAKDSRFSLKQWGKLSKMGMSRQKTQDGILRLIRISNCKSWTISRQTLRSTM